MAEGEPQPEIQTADEIAAQFPDEWILMKIEFTDDNRLDHGFSIRHSSDHKEILDAAARIIEREEGLEQKSKVYMFHGSTRLLSSAESIPQFEEDSLDQLLTDMGKYELEDQ